MKKRCLCSEIIYTFVSLTKGLYITFINFWRKKITMMYPEERWELPEGYRGMPVLPADPETGREKCLACGSCARICPEHVITIKHEVGEDKKRRLVEFNIDMSRCMFCGLCTEACPTKGLVMSKHFELASFSRKDMIYGIDDLRRLGGVFPKEPAKEAAADGGEA
ncbi:MAG: NADH-quinone oxidoreductase subunit I [Armatimonadota bacterium]